MKKLSAPSSKQGRKKPTTSPATKDIRIIEKAETVTILDEWATINEEESNSGMSAKCTEAMSGRTVDRTPRTKTTINVPEDLAVQVDVEITNVTKNRKLRVTLSGKRRCPRLHPPDATTTPTWARSQVKRVTQCKLTTIIVQR